jgi:hypothetical protein
MAKIVYLFAFVALIQVAAAINCYSCDKNSCQNEMSKWQTLECAKNTASPSLVGGCLKQVYTDKATNKEVTSRRCIVAEKKPDGTIIHNCNDNEGKTSECVVCTSDLCNPATSINFSFVTVLGVIAVYLIPKFM